MSDYTPTDYLGPGDDLPARPPVPRHQRMRRGWIAMFTAGALGTALAFGLLATSDQDEQVRIAATGTAFVGLCLFVVVHAVLYQMARRRWRLRRVHGRVIVPATALLLLVAVGAAAGTT